MHRAALVASILVGTLAASCAVGTEEGLSPGNAGPRDSAIATDGDGAPDDGSLVDTGAPEDTSPGDGSVDTAAPEDTAVVDTGTADTGAPDTGAPDTGAPDTGAPDTGAPDTGAPDTGAPDTGAPDTGAPDTGACPVLGCATGTENRSGCANARTNGRTTAASSTGYKISDDTCLATNKFTDSSSSCWGSNNDHAYRLWMKAGETVSLQLSTSWPCSFDLWDWYASLKIFESSGCDDKACGARTFCSNDDYLHSRTFVAPRDGWYVFVVDGASSWDDEGDYTFTVKLTCNEPGCGC